MSAQRGWRLKVTILNLEKVDVPPTFEMRSVAGDARDLSQFPNRSFDICYSNSVIEHVGSLTDQAAMAREVARVGKSYLVQTPNRWFPIEPHFLMPGWQFMPVAFRKTLLKRFDLGWMKAEPDKQQAESNIREIRLMTSREISSLFPDARIHRERIGLLTKSLVAMRD